MKHIVILGGGFAGVGAGIELKKLSKEHKITLINNTSYQLFYPSLYEVATSEEPQKNVAIPLSEIFGSNFSYLNETVDSIDGKRQLVKLRDGLEIPYDYLLISLGSQPAYYNIPGLKEHSIPLKTIHDAILIKKKIKTMYCNDSDQHKKMQVVIGGGGFTGTELAAELLQYKSNLAREHNYGTDCMNITIIQGSDRLLKELDNHVSSIAQKRLQQPQVNFAFGGHIKQVSETDVITDDGKSYPYDILLWTGGIEASHVAGKSGLPVDKRGQLLVDQTLQVQGYANIFAAGDNTVFIDPTTQKPIPTVAQVAEEQGHIAGKNIVQILNNQPLLPYHYRHFGYVIPIRGRFAVAELMKGVHFDGFAGWILQQLVFLRYLLGILPLHKALMKWNKFEMEMTK